MVEGARGFHFERLRPTRLPSRSHRSFPFGEIFGPNSVPWIRLKCKCVALLTTAVSCNELPLSCFRPPPFTRESLRCRRLECRQSDFPGRGTAQPSRVAFYNPAPPAPSPPRR